MTATVIPLPVMRGGPTDRSERARLIARFRGKTREDMRMLWDRWDCDDPLCQMIGEGDPFGYLDDIHSYMNMIGDGAYCAV